MCRLKTNPISPVSGNTPPPVVVTMDLGLPDFDGLEASRRIRTFSDAYLVIVTGRVDEADAIMDFEGADDFLTKPFRPRELRARIAAMLRRPRRHDPRSGTMARCRAAWDS